MGLQTNLLSNFNITSLVLVFLPVIIGLTGKIYIKFIRSRNNSEDELDIIKQPGDKYKALKI
jgi:hypothetical protein